MTNIDEIDRPLRTAFDQIQKQEILPGTASVLLQQLNEVLPALWKEAINNEERRGKDKARDLAVQKRKHAEAVRKIKNQVTDL
jgi:hypothetical protein